MMTFTVVGIPQAQARIAQVGTALAGATLPAVEAGAEIIEEDAKARLQAWPAILSGDLLDSIHKELQAAGPGAASMDVLTDNDHAWFVEKGTTFMAAQPFMRPSADENEDMVVAAAASVFRGAISVFA